MDVLRIWTVYRHPPGFPDHYVARATVVGRLGAPVADVGVLVATTLDGVREQLPPGLYRMDRHPHDTPSIVETWF